MTLDHRIGRATAAAVNALLHARSHTATVYLSDRLTIRATRVLFKRRVPTGRLSRYDVVLTIGRPNVRARAFIAKAKRAGEPFPVRKVQLTFPPKAKR